MRKHSFGATSLLLILLPSHVDPSSRELAFEVFVAAVEVVNAVDVRFAVSDEAGEDERYAGAEVGAHHVSALQERAVLALYRGCRAHAFLEGRDYAIPDDVRSLASSVFEHRILLAAEAELDEVQPEVLIQRVLEAVPVPKGSLTL